MFRNSHQKCSVRKGVLRNFVKFTGNHLCQNLLQAWNLIKIETLAQVFSCEFCEMSIRAPFLQNTSERLLLYIVRRADRGRSFLSLQIILRVSFTFDSILLNVL